MISQTDIIRALHNNTCSECGRHFMFAERVERREKAGEVVPYFYVTCGFCANSWELTKETFDAHVRICDTITYKQFHPELTDADSELDGCIECGTIIDNSFEVEGELTCRVCGNYPGFEED